MRFARAWVVAVCAAGCYSGDSSSTEKAPERPPTLVAEVTLRGRLIHKDTAGPMTKSLVFIEVGGRYLTNPDPSKGHPDYRYVAATKEDGTFEVRVPPGIAADGTALARWGLHTFENGFRYGTDLIEIDESGNPKRLEVTISPHLAEDVKPIASEFTVSPAKVAPGGKVVFTAFVKASGNLLADDTIEGDALSEEVLIGEPTTHWARAMDPPRRGIQGKGYANGIWRHEGPAPTKPGKYTFHLVASSERCITSDRVSVELEVDQALDASADAPAVVGACNSVPSLDAPRVLWQIATTAPPAQGGTIADGTYVLSAYRRYTGVGGASGPKPGTTFQETAVLAGNVLSVSLGDSTFHAQETYRHEVSGNTFTHTRTCPAPANEYSGTYTASGTSVSYFEPSPEGVVEFAFERVK